MSTTRTTRFCVRFTATICYKIALRARSEHDAIAKAKKLWESGCDASFRAFEGSTDSWDAAAE